MEAVGIPCRNKCVCYKMSANYRKKPIVINVDDIEKEYLYAGDCCSTDEFVCVGNILNFIEEIVKNGGDPYWTINENQYRDFSKK